MYTLIRAVGKPRTTQHRWVDVEVADTAMSKLYSDYDKLYLILTNPFIPNEVTLDIDEIRHQYSTSNLTVTEVLVETGNKNLPTINTIPQVTNKYLRYADAFQAGYKVTPVNKGKAIDADIPKGDKESLYVTKANLDYQLFKDHCVCLVNGYLHYTDVNDQGIWVVDGMKSNNYSGHATLGILSFKELGKIKSIGFKPDMIYKLADETTYGQQLVIDVGESITDKTLILVIGGYMHILDKRSFTTYNDTSILVNTVNLPIAERFHESRQWLDFSELPYIKNSNNESAFNITDFFSDENILAYFTMSQSFIILLDNNEVFVEREFIRRPPTPKLAIIPNDNKGEVPNLPLTHMTGRMANYWAREDKGHWAIHLDDNQWSQRNYWTIRDNLIEAKSDHELPGNEVELSRVAFLKIGSDISLG